MLNSKPLLLSVVIFFVFLSSAFAQRFEEGYYTDREGNRREVQIENKRWSIWSNEALTVIENGQKKQIPIDEIQEFGIDGEMKFITAEVNLDRSSNWLSDLGFDPKPNFVEERVLLKVLVEGELSLYLFLENNIKKFFYKRQGEELKQLIFKRYKKVVGSRVVVNENVAFRKQLKEIAICGSTEDYDKINYELGPLKKAVLAQNNCKNAEVDFVSARGVRARLRLNVGAGAIHSLLTVERAFNDFNMNAISPTAVVELEYIIPTIRHEVGVKLNAVYNSFEVEDEIEFPHSMNLRKVHISHSEIFLGPSVEYRYFLNNSSAISGGVGYYFPLLLEESTYTETVSRLDKTGSNASPFPGIFLSYGFNRLHLKLQAFVGSKLLEEDINNFSVDLQRISLTLGYSLLLFKEQRQTVKSKALL